MDGTQGMDPSRPMGFGWGGAMSIAPGAFVPPTERPTQFVPPGEAGKAPTKLAITGRSSAPMAIADASTFVIPKQPYTNDKGVCIAELDINNYPEWARRQMAFGRNLKGVEERTTAKCQLKGQYRPPGSTEPQTDKVLYVEISATTMAVVQRAKSAVHAMIEEFAKKTLAIPSGGR
jgi:hypothetical protein